MDSLFHQSMTWLTENDITGALDLSFTVSEEIFGQVRVFYQPETEMECFKCLASRPKREEVLGADHLYVTISLVTNLLSKHYRPKFHANDTFSLILPQAHPSIE